MSRKEKDSEHDVEDYTGDVHYKNGAGVADADSLKDDRQEEGNARVEHNSGCDENDGNNSANHDEKYEKCVKKGTVTFREQNAGSDSKERSESECDSPEDGEDSEHSENGSSTASGVTGSYEVQSLGSSNDPSQSSPSTSPSRRSSLKSLESASHTRNARASGGAAVSGDEDETDARVASKTSGSETGSSDKGTLDSDQDHSSEAEDDSPALPEEVASPNNLSPVQDVDPEAQATAVVETSELVMPEEVTISEPNVHYSLGEPTELPPEAEQITESKAGRNEQDKGAVSEVLAGPEGKDKSLTKLRTREGANERPQSVRLAECDVAKVVQTSPSTSASAAAAPGVGVEEMESSPFSDSSLKSGTLKVKCTDPFQISEQDHVVRRSTEKVDQRSLTSGTRGDEPSNLQEAFTKTLYSGEKANDAESYLEKFIADKIESFIREAKTIKTPESCPQSSRVTKSSEGSTTEEQGTPKLHKIEYKNNKIGEMNSATTSTQTPLTPVEGASALSQESHSESQLNSAHTDEGNAQIGTGPELLSFQSRTGTKPKQGKFVRFYKMPRTGNTSPQTRTKASVRLRTKANQRRKERLPSICSSDQNAELSSKSSLGRSRSRLHLDLPTPEYKLDSEQRRNLDSGRRKYYEDKPNTNLDCQHAETRGRFQTYKNVPEPEVQSNEESKSTASTKVNTIEGQPNLTSQASSYELVNSPSSNTQPGSSLQEQASWIATGARPRTSRIHRSRQTRRSETTETPAVNASANEDKNESEAKSSENSEGHTTDAGTLEALRESLVRVLNIGPNSTVPANGPAMPRVTSPRLDLQLPSPQQQLEGVLNSMSNLRRPPATGLETRTIAEIIHRSDGTSRYLVLNGANDPLEEFVVLSRRLRYNADAEQISSRRNTRLTIAEQVLPPIDEQPQEEEKEEEKEETGGVELHRDTSSNIFTKIGICFVVLMLGTCVWRLRTRS